MAATNKILPDPDARTSDDVAAKKLLKVQTVAANRKNPQRTKSNGSSAAGGRSAGGTKLRGGAF